jgi:hypothetical protein
MAIHYHSNQLSAICELVCTTLGMKLGIRLNTMTRLRNIFVQQIFVEKVILILLKILVKAKQCILGCTMLYILLVRPN